MSRELRGYLEVLVKLAQERNLLALESLGELRDIHEEVHEQTELLEMIAAAVLPPPPAVLGPLKRTVLIFGSTLVKNPKPEREQKCL